uniref:Uncharacterized protein n=1 Tax=Salix viminalis TaxID=40686 RepID=A0A6N2M7F8_SALVM
MNPVYHHESQESNHTSKHTTVTWFYPFYFTNPPSSLAIKQHVTSLASICKIHKPLITSLNTSGRRDVFDVERRRNGDGSGGGGDGSDTPADATEVNEDTHSGESWGAGV